MRQDLIDALELIYKDLCKATVYYVDTEILRIVQYKIIEIKISNAFFEKKKVSFRLQAYEGEVTNYAALMPDFYDMLNEGDRMFFFGYDEARQKLIELLTERREELLRG